MTDKRRASRPDLIEFVKPESVRNIDSSSAAYLTTSQLQTILTTNQKAISIYLEIADQHDEILTSLSNKEKEYNFLKESVNRKIESIEKKIDDKLELIKQKEDDNKKLLESIKEKLSNVDNSNKEGFNKIDKSFFKLTLTIGGIIGLAATIIKLFI